MLSVALFACDPIRLSPVPSSTATVYGNGGSAVVKDGYIYFANAYIDMGTLGINDNKYDKGSAQTLYAIYRAKLDNAGKVKLDDDGVPTGVEIVTYNVGGYAYSGLYICGDYLYYSTPYARSNDSGETITGLVRFERVKLDGTGRETIYAVTNYDSTCDYDILYVNKIVYIVYTDTDKNLNIVKCKGGNVNKYLNIASDVESFRLYEQQNVVNEETLPDAYNYVYYVTESNGRHSLCRKVLDCSAEAQVLQSTSAEIKLISVKNSRVYYVMDSKIYSTAFPSTGAIDKCYSTSSVSESTSNTIVDYVVLDDNNRDLGILGVYYDGSTYAMFVFNSTAENLNVTSSSKITLLATMDGDVYYQIADDNALYKRSLSFPSSHPELSEAVVVAPNFSTYGDNDKAKLDYDIYRFYVYASHETSTNKYLTMYMISNPYLDGDGEVVGQYIGKVDANDVAVSEE